MSEDTFTAEDQYMEYCNPIRILQVMDDFSVRYLDLALEYLTEAGRMPKLAERFRRRADDCWEKYRRIAKQIQGAIVTGVQKPSPTSNVLDQTTAVQFFDDLESAIRSCAQKEHIIKPEYICDLSPRLKEPEECIRLLSQHDQFAGTLVEIGIMVGAGYERRAMYLRSDKTAEPKLTLHPKNNPFIPQKVCSVPARIREKTLTSV